MHYRNGREAKNGDKVIQLSTVYYDDQKVQITAVGILFDAKPGQTHCNGGIAPILGGPTVGACICDCIHADDLASILTMAGLHKRPEGM